MRSHLSGAYHPLTFVMDLTTVRTEVILSQAQTSLGYHTLEQNPQPGGYLDIEGQTYQILERRHRYRFKAGRYQLHHVALYVQKSQVPDDRRLLDGHWVIGDASCSYNALSPVLRCAVNPMGPCDRCFHYQPLE
ncbi:MAG: DUF6464 family protein [Leptolyngbyaceae cyanobacterium bins.302]|nr:DUF6464 family protein [Leptolyngbyaceae cyanobacterium bins.302]